MKNHTCSMVSPISLKPTQFVSPFYQHFGDVTRSMLSKYLVTVIIFSMRSTSSGSDGIKLLEFIAGINDVVLYDLFILTESLLVIDCLFVGKGCCSPGAQHLYEKKQTTLKEANHFS